MLSWRSSLLGIAVAVACAVPCAAIADVAPSLRTAIKAPVAAGRHIVISDVDAEIEGALLSRLYAADRYEILDRRGIKDAAPKSAGTEVMLSAHLTTDRVTTRATGMAVAEPVREISLRLVEFPSGRLLWATAAYGGATVSLDDLAALLVAGMAGEKPGAEEPVATIPLMQSAVLKGASTHVEKFGDDIVLICPRLPERVFVEFSGSYHGGTATSVYDQDSSNRTQLVQIGGPGGSLGLGWRVWSPSKPSRPAIRLVGRASSVHFTDSLRYRKSRSGALRYSGLETHDLSATLLPYELGARYGQWFGQYEVYGELTGALIGALPLSDSIRGSGDALNPATGAAVGTFTEARNATVEAAAGYGFGIRLGGRRELLSRLGVFARIGYFAGSVTGRFRDESFTRKVTVGGTTTTETGNQSFDYVDKPGAANQIQRVPWRLHAILFEVGLDFALIR